MRPIGWMLALAGTSACAEVIETRTVSSRFVEQQRPYDRQVRQGLDVHASTDGVTMAIEVRRDATCEWGNHVEGMETVRVHRALTYGAATPYVIAGVTILGLGEMIAGGVELAQSRWPNGGFAPDGPQGPSNQQIFGVLLLGAGVAAVASLGWNLLRTVGSNESRYFHDDVRVVDGPCPAQSRVEPVVALRSPMDPEHQVFRVPPLSGEGRVAVDLLAVLPSRAFVGPHPWPGVEILLDGEAVKIVDLMPVRAVMADRAWIDAVANGRADGFTEFRTAFPLDPRVAQIAETLERSQHARPTPH